MAQSNNYPWKRDRATKYKNLTPWSDQILDYHVKSGEPIIFKDLNRKSSYSGPLASPGPKGLMQDVIVTIGDENTNEDVRMIYNEKGRDIFDSESMVDEHGDLLRRFYTEMTIEGGELRLDPRNPRDLVKAEFLLLSNQNESYPKRPKSSIPTYRYEDVMMERRASVNSEKTLIQAQNLVYNADEVMLVTQAEARRIDTAMYHLVKASKGKSKSDVDAIETAITKITRDLINEAKKDPISFMELWVDEDVQLIAEIQNKVGKGEISFNSKEKTWHFSDKKGNFGQVITKLSAIDKDPVRGLVNQARRDQDVMEALS